MSYTWKTYQEAATGGSDCPVEMFSPWNGIYSLVARKDLDGYPEGGVQPEEKLSVYDAVCMFSKNIPYANGEQDLMGTIEAGKFADGRQSTDILRSSVGLVSCQISVQSLNIFELVFRNIEDISVYDDHICKLACFDGSHEILFAVSIRNIL